METDKPHKLIPYSNSISNRAALFDMDGLLLNTEPVWAMSMIKAVEAYKIPIRPDQFRLTRGLRIYEVTEFWESRFPWPGKATSEEIADFILEDIIETARNMPNLLMPGVLKVLNWFRNQNIKTALATSSPMKMVTALVETFKLNPYFDALISADSVAVGKPHPAVFLEAAKTLDILPGNCVVFEDSVNGVVAGKAARMKVVAVPDPQQFTDLRFSLADLKLKSLLAFDENKWKFLIEQ